MKIYNNILLLSLITLFITSCSDSKEESYVFNADSAIAFNAKRLAPSENNASIQEVFNTGDTIKIYGKNGDMYPYLFADEYNALEPVDPDNAIT